MKKYKLIIAVSIIFIVSNVVPVKADPIVYKWIQDDVFSVFDDVYNVYVVHGVPVTSSGIMVVSETYLETPGDPMTSACDVYLFYFTLTDALGDTYSWLMQETTVLDLEFINVEGFALDFHLFPNNVVGLNVSDPIHDGYSRVGESSVYNVSRNDPMYHENYQGINFSGYWQVMENVPEPGTFFIMGALFLPLIIIHRYSKMK